MSKHYYQNSNVIKMLRNPRKCKSSVVITRSSWELKFILKYLDINENILEWVSEDVVIEYFSPLDGRNHRYFIDFWYKAKTKDGKIKEFLIEVKPFSQTQEPKVPQRKTKNYLNEVQTYIKNQSKWETVERYCLDQRQKGRDISFHIISEKDCPWFVK